MEEGAQRNQLKLNERQLILPIGNSIRRNQGQKQRVQPRRNLKIPELKINPEETEHMNMYRRIIKFLNFTGTLLGFTCRYDWKWHSHFFSWLANFLICFGCLSSLFTQYVHCQNGEYIRILELCSLFGVVVSVI